MVRSDVLTAVDQSASEYCHTGNVAAYLDDIEAIKRSGVIEDHRLWRLANGMVWLHGGGLQIEMVRQ